MSILGDCCRWFLFPLIRWSQKKKEGGGKHILLYRVDGIGDYILFRPFIKAIVESERFEDCTFHFVGNASWRELFEAWDGHGFSSAVWLDPQEINSNPLARWKALRQINVRSYGIVFCPSFSRQPYITDDMLYAIHAEQTIGVRGDESKLNTKHKNLTKRIYTTCYDLRTEPLRFEVETNRMNY